LSFQGGHKTLGGEVFPPGRALTRVPLKTRKSELGKKKGSRLAAQKKNGWSQGGKAAASTVHKGRKEHPQKKQRDGGKKKPNY